MKIFRRSSHTAYRAERACGDCDEYSGSPTTYIDKNPRKGEMAYCGRVKAFVCQSAIACSLYHRMSDEEWDARMKENLG